MREIAKSQILWRFIGALIVGSVSYLVLCLFPAFFDFLTPTHIVIVSIVMALAFLAFGGRIVDWICAIIDLF